MNLGSGRSQAESSVNVSFLSNATSQTLFPLTTLTGLSLDSRIVFRGEFEKMELRAFKGSNSLVSVICHSLVL